MNKTSLFIFVISLVFSNCTKDIGYLPFCDANPSTFNTNIGPIIETKCATSNCHAEGFVMGNFKNYSGVKANIDNGRFQNMLFGNKLMPPAGSEPLTEDEYKKIKCWLDDGAPEN